MKREPRADPSWSAVRSVFDAAVELPEGERVSFVQRCCGKDVALASEVLALLAAHNPDDAFLQPAVPGPPQRLGPFTLGPLLGSGGMGAVYAATQDAPRRTVALKVLHPGWPGVRDRVRFAREAELLARLRHSGIAQVHAAGAATTAAGQVAWIAMELVQDARPLTRYASEQQLDTRARVALVVEVCAAVEHAHRAGIVHRDLKPGNILVGNDGAPRVIDFGIASVEGPVLHAAAATVAGDLLGTLAYMSPEQASGAVALVDRRSDVHALGAILYELLTGRLPFPTEGKLLPEALRILIESPPLAAPELDADLRAIVWQAMARHKDDRYPSAAALGADLQRWLRHELVSARPPRLRDVLRMWWHRHTAAVVAGCVAVAAMLVASGVAIAFAWLAAARAEDAESAHRLAAAKAHAAEQSLDVLVDSIRGMNPFRQPDRSTVDQLLDHLAGRIGQEQYDAAVQARLHHALAASYRGIGRTDRARAHASDGLAALDRCHGGGSGQLRTELWMLLGVACAEARDLDAAASALTTALESLQCSDSDHPLRLVAGARLAAVHLLRGEAEAAEQLLQSALSAAPTGDAASVELAEALANLGNASWQRGREAEAAELWRRALSGFGKSLSDQHPLVAQVRSNLGMHLQAQGHLAEAEQLFAAARDLFAVLRGQDCPDVANAELKLAFLHVDQGELDRATAAAERALAIRRTHFGADAAEVPGALQALAYVRLQAADYQGAAAVCDEALRLRLRGSPPNHAEIAGARLLLGRALMGAGRSTEAEPHLVAAAEGRQALFGASHWRTATARSALGECRLRLGELAAARELLHGSLPVIEAAFPTDHPELRAARSRLAELQRQAGEPGERARNPGR